MGQRLIVEFRYDGETIFGLYQHWSAYTQSAFETVYSLIQCDNDLGTGGHWKKPTSYKEAVLQAMEMASNIQGVVWDNYNPAMKDKDDESFGWSYVRKTFTGDDDQSKAIRALSEKFSNVGDRSTGLVMIGKEAENCLDLGEYSIAINLDDQDIQFDVFNFFEGLAEYVDCYGGEADKPSNLVLPQNVYLDNFKYDDIDCISPVIDKMAEGYQFYVPSIGYDKDVIFGAIA